MRAVQRLPFCYLCGINFTPDDVPNRDHVPPENMFMVEDRVPLLFATHPACNKSYEKLDEKFGQLVALRHGKVPTSVDHRRLQFVVSPDLARGAIANLNIDLAVWRWVAGFHAALYREPLFYSAMRSLVTPFPRTQIVDGKIVPELLLPQHGSFVEWIKLNRAKQNLDRIVANKGKTTYECVWVQGDNNGPWMCVFALDIYDWKDLGRTPIAPARGCAGSYVTISGTAPATAAKWKTSPIRAPNLDPLDPFGP